MGINRLWREKLQSVFGWPEMTHQDAQRIGYIEDDMELNMYRVVCGVGSWAMLGERVRERVLAMLCTPAAVRYRVLFDDSRFVPENKRVEQQQRTRAASASDSRRPFSPEEQRAIVIGETPIPEPTGIFFQRLMATRALRHKLRAFLTSELATIALPVGKCLVVDGGIPSGISAMARAPASTLRFVNASDFDEDAGAASAAADDGDDDDDTTSAPEFVGLTTPTTAPIMSAIYAAFGTACTLDNNNSRGYDDGLPAKMHDVAMAPSLSAPTTVTITRRTDGVPGNDVHVATKASIVGEGDFKIAAGISSAPRGAHIFVRSCDTDMLPILLVNMRRWIDTDEDGGGPRYSIHLNTNGAVAVANEKPVLNITKLWGLVVRRFLTNFPWVCYPVETLATLMLLTGSDYLKTVFVDPATKEEKMSMGLPQLGPAAVWKAFCDPAVRNVLFPRRNEHASSIPVIMDRVHSDTAQPIRIGIDETRWFNFIACMYHQKIFGVYPSAQAFARGRYDFTLAHSTRQRAFDAAATKQTDPTRISPACKWFPPTPAALFVFVRQVSWHLYYLANGASTEPFRDPFEVTAMGQSIYGWAMINGGSTVVITTDVQESPYTT